MIERYKKMIALGVTVAFLALLPGYALPLPAQTQSRDKETVFNADQTRDFIEKEQQVGFQASPRNVLPVLLGIAAVAAGIFLLVLLISKDKYDISGVWDFHNEFTTDGNADFDSVWTFTSYDSRSNVMGTYSRNAAGAVTQGQFTVVNKKEVVFQDDWMTEQYVGQFDSKTTMSGTFVLVSGAKGNWTAKKK